MGSINQQALIVSMVQNQYVPSEGPKAIPIALDFTGAVGTYVLDATQFQELGNLQMVQTIFADLSGSANPMTITINGSGQQVVCKAHTQGYYPVLCPNPVKLQFDSATSGSVIPIELINVAIAGVVWPTV